MGTGVKRPLELELAAAKHRAAPLDLVSARYGANSSTPLVRGCRGPGVLRVWFSVFIRSVVAATNQLPGDPWFCLQRPAGCQTRTTGALFFSFSVFIRSVVAARQSAAPFDLDPIPGVNFQF